MATTKAFELAQLSALTTVDASGNVTTNTSQIANASGDLILDSAADIVLNADGADIILADDTVDFGRFKRDNGHLVIKSETIDKSVIIKGTTTSNAVVTALTFDMANSGRATFSENVIIAGTLTGLTDFNSSGDMSVGGDLTVTGDLTVEGTQVTLNTTTLDVEDKNITLNYHASNDTSASADGAGITIQDAVDASTNASILWNASDDEFTFSHPITVSDSIYSVGSSPRVQLKDSDGTNQFSFFQQSSSQLSLRLRNDATDGSFLVAGYGGSTTTNRFLIGSTGDISFYEDNSGSPQVGMHWDYADGRLGIGTTAPVDLLTIQSPASGGGNGITLKRNDNGTDQRVGAISFGNTEDDDLAVIAVKTSTGNNSDGNLEFYTQLDADTTPTKRMTIASDGKVGIGTDDPQSHIEIEQTGSTVFDATDTSGQAGDGATLAIQNLSDTNDTFSQILFRNRNASKAVSRIASITNGTGTDLAFVVENQGSAPSEVMRIVKSGKVGIGTDDPDQPLHVQGTRPLRLERSGVGEYEISIDNVVTGDSLDFVIEPVSGSNSAGFQVRTRQTDGTLITPFSINHDGEVGIGTTDPIVSLHIGDGTTDEFIIIDKGASNTSGILFRNGGSNKVKLQVNSSEELEIHTNNTRKARITESGTVYSYSNQPESRATLKLDFANLKKLHPRISFTRNSIGSYYDEEGTLKYAGYNKPRFDHNPVTGESKGLLIEEDRSNHILYSQDLRPKSGQWVAYQANVEHSSEMSPEKKMNAWKISNTVSGLTYGFMNRGITNQATANAVSVYAKAGSGTFTRLGMSSRSTYSLGVIYDLTGDGSVVHTYNGNGTVHSSDIEYVGYGWYRCSFVAVNLGQVNLHPLESTHSNANDLNGNVNYSKAGGYVHVYNPQVENSYYITSPIKNDPLFTTRSSSATYIDEEGTLQTSPSNTPRYSHKWNGQKFVPTGLVLENARSNYQGNFFDNNTRGWSANQNAQADRTTEYAPDGSRTAYNMYSQITSSAVKSIYRNRAITQGNMVTYSVFAKSNSLNQIFMYTDGISPTVGGVYYNLDTGATSLQNGTGYAFTEYGMEKYGNGWWRCWFSAAASTGSQAYHHIDLAVGSSRSFNSNVNDGVLLWGPSLEYGQTPGSYIYTTGNAGITRSEDLANTVDTPRKDDIVELTDAEDLIPQPHGTIYTEWDTNESSGQFCGIFEILDSGSNGIDHRYTGSNLQYYLTDNISITIGAGPTPGVAEKTALAYDLTSVIDTVTARNGGTTNGNTPHKFPLELKSIRLGSIDFNPAYQLNGHIRSFRMYSERMSQDEINALTEND